MNKTNDIKMLSELKQLCESVKKLASEGRYSECKAAVCQAMEKYPHAPHPHNLLGIILEKTGDHFRAMRHFRAAWALDPSYLPADHNLQTYGTFFSNGNCAYDERDLPPTPINRCAIIYDSDGIGHVVQEGK